MNMSNNRKIEIYFNVYAIPPEIPWLSFYTENPEFILKDVYLGTRVAPMQMFWMYNNTKHCLHFEFDTEDIKHMCRIDGFQVKLYKFIYHRTYVTSQHTIQRGTALSNTQPFSICNSFTHLIHIHTLIFASRHTLIM